MQFGLTTSGTWILAERLQLSPIVAVVSLAAVTARYMPARTSARDRVNSLRCVGNGGVRAQRARVPVDGSAGARHFE